MLEFIILIARLKLNKIIKIIIEYKMKKKIATKKNTSITLKQYITP